MVHYGNILEKIEDTPTDVIKQIRTDWTQVPFVEVQVTNDWYCPSGWTEIFSRPWYGI